MLNLLAPSDPTSPTTHESYVGFRGPSPTSTSPRRCCRPMTSSRHWRRTAPGARRREVRHRETDEMEVEHRIHHGSGIPRGRNTHHEPIKMTQPWFLCNICKAGILYRSPDSQTLQHFGPPYFLPPSSADGEHPRSAHRCGRQSELLLVRGAVKGGAG